MSAWIIQDGNYPDIQVGQTAEFAVEFWISGEASNEASIVVSDAAISANHRADYLYDAVAEVVLRTTDVTVLDISILVYGQRRLLRPAVSEASRLSVRIGLGVDPFFYIE